MADEIENEQLEDEGAEAEAVKHPEPEAASIRAMIRQELESILGQIPGEGVVQPSKDLDAPVTLRDLERISRETVEAAMAPLREAQPKPKPKPAKPKPKLEPEPAAPLAAKEVKSKVRSWLWGDEDA